MKRMRKWEFWRRRHDEAEAELARTQRVLAFTKSRLERTERQLRDATGLIAPAASPFVFYPGATVDVEHQRMNVIVDIIPLHRGWSMPVGRRESHDPGRAMALVADVAWDQISGMLERDLRQAIASSGCVVKLAKMAGR